MNCIFKWWDSYNDIKDYDDILLIGEEKAYNAPSKYLLYNDPFLGTMDYRIAGFENQYYTELLQKLSAVSTTGEYQFLFDYAKSLCDVLTVKSELGVQTREAYISNDKERLRDIAENAYLKTIEKVKVFHQIYQNWWMHENKSQGFEVQDIRLGGLVQRLESCKERLIAYCNGESESIAELEEPLLADDCGCTWGKIVTPGVVSHSF